MDAADSSDEYGGQISDFEDLVIEPGATVLWFGKRKGTRLDKLEERYRRDLLHLPFKSTSRDLVEFRKIHKRYLDWLDERQSPLSTKIWFGKWEGHEIHFLYYNRPRRWRWLIKNFRKWRNDPLDIQERYSVWRQKHPKRACSSRAATNIVNPMGEKLEPEDEGQATDNDQSYSSDDGFVVKSDEDDAQDSSIDDDLDGEEAVSQFAEVLSETDESSLESSDSNENAEIIVPTAEGHYGDSDSSLPSMTDILKTSSNQTSTKAKAKFHSAHEAQQSARESGERGHNPQISDMGAPLVVSKPTGVLGNRKRRRQNIVLSSSDDTDIESVIPVLRKCDSNRSRKRVIIDPNLHAKIFQD